MAGLQVAHIRTYSDGHSAILADGPCATLNCDDGNPCTTDSCDAATGLCVHTNNSNSCDDGNACTTNDHCSGGSCAGTAVICTALDQCHDAGTCSAGVCSNPIKTNGTACNDGNACTTNDVCTSGTCGGTAINCNDNNVCTTDSCNPATGCVYTNNTLACNDGNACTVNDMCSNGVCAGTPTNGPGCGGVGVDTTNNNFTMLDETGGLLGGTNDVHFTWDGTLKTSVSTTGQVSNATLTSTTPFLGTRWTVHDMAIYAPGIYTVYPGCPAKSPGCGTGVGITFTVAPGEIGVHMLYDWSVNKNIDVVDVWKPGVFAPSSLYTGATGSNPASRIWDWMSKDWGSAIDTDGDGYVDTIQNGVLDGINGVGMIDGPFIGWSANFNVMGSLCTGIVCDDGNVCTTDSCDPATGQCIFTNNTLACDDGNACTLGDVCSNGVCQPGAAKNCDDGNACTTDSCDTATGACINTAKNCDDGNVCTTDSCNPATGACVHTNNTLACDDGNACTLGDVCSNGACQPGAAKNCDDGNVCTTDSCNTTTGACEHTNNTLSCDDGNACTVNDTCSGGVCAGTTRNCDDHNACTADTCNPSTGCVNTPIVCNDNSACTTDTCNPATGCVFTPIVCDDNNPYTVDTCDPATGCVNTPITVTPVVVGSGTISPSFKQNVIYNSTKKFKVVATRPGYHIASVTGCNGTLTGGNYLTGSITSSCTVTATFAINTYTVTPAAKLNGSMSPDAQTVNYNGTTSFTVTPDTGYDIKSVRGCNGTWDGATNTFTTGPVIRNCTVTATFAPHRYTVTPAAGANGSIAPSSAVLVKYSTTKAFRVKADAGFQVDTVTGCGGTWTGSNPYITGPITGDCTIEATFKSNP